MLPLMEIVCYRLWKWYVTAYGNGMLPLMEMVCYRLWKWYITAYGNGMLLCIVTSYILWNYVLRYSNSVLHFMAMAYDRVCMGFWVI